MSPIAIILIVALSIWLILAIIRLVMYSRNIEKGSEELDDKVR